MVLVPFIHLSVYLFRGLHPTPIVLKPSAPSLDPEMLRTLLISFAAFTLLYVGLVTLAYGIRLAQEAEERRRMPETPSNGGYMVAAYVVATVIYLGYALVLWRRARLVNREEN